MDESACLLRSFSNPPQVSREVKEGDPIRCLTESISFGRFMSESLAWEKWSTFSHNRYMEEVEQFLKPGSVARKKAFFEAHYKKRAAMRATALLEQANIASQTGTINAASVEPSLATDLANFDTSPASNQHEKDVSYAEIANTAGVDTGHLCAVRENTDVSDVEPDLAVMEDVNMEECQQVEDSKALGSGNVHGKITATPEDCADSKNSTSSSKKRQRSSSSKSSVPSKASKLPLHPSKRVASTQARSDVNVAKPTRCSTDTKKTIPKSLPVSISFAGKTNKTSLRPTPPQKQTRALKKSADQENLAPSRGNRQLNSASNFSPRPSETNKTLPKISGESSTLLQTLTRASVNRGLKHASKAHQPRDKITISVVNKPVLATGDRRLPSHSSCSKSSNASRTSTRSPVSFFPFSFRSEERAAKRKEAEKSQMQLKPEEKAKNDMNKIGQSTDVKARSNEDSCHASQLSHKYIKKISSSQPPSPKLGRKPYPSAVQDANSRPSRKPSINSETSKNGLMKISRITCLGTKNRHENASPNIQLTVAKRSISYKHEHGGSVARRCDQ